MTPAQKQTFEDRVDAHLKHLYDKYDEVIQLINEPTDKTLAHAVNAYLMEYFKRHTSYNDYKACMKQVDDLIYSINLLKNAGLTDEVLALRVYDALLAGMRYGDWNHFSEARTEPKG